MIRRRKKTSYRRRRVSGLGGGMLMKTLGVIAGAVVANMVAAKIPIGDSKVKAAAVVGLGIFFPKLLKGGFGESIGAGMVATGGVQLVSSLGLISGIGQIDDGGVMAGHDGDLSVIAGDDDGSVMAGGEDLSVLAGMEDEENY